MCAISSGAHIGKRKIVRRSFLERQHQESERQREETQRQHEEVQRRDERIEYVDHQVEERGISIEEYYRFVRGKDWLRGGIPTVQQWRRIKRKRMS